MGAASPGITGFSAKQSIRGMGQNTLEKNIVQNKALNLHLQMKKTSFSGANE